MAAKRIFYVTASGLTVLYCENGQVEELGRFDTTPEGIADFGEQVRKQADVPSAVLMDVVEEEFRIETLPHLIGPDRNKLLDRKMGALFRSTPFRTVTAFGRERNKERRDQMLFSALTKPEGVEPWLNEMRAHKVPLVGIYSLPILTRLLIKRMGIKHPNTLVLSIQQGRLLRQSFMSNGALKISRLSPMSGGDNDSCLATVQHEVDRNQRYLGRLQLLSFKDPMEVVLISEGSQLERFKEGCADTNQVHYKCINLNEIASKIGLKQVVTAGQGEWCFAYFLSKNTPPSNYAPQKERLYYNFFRARRSMVAASVVFAFAATSWSMLNIYEGEQYKLRAAQVEQDIQRANSIYEREMAKLPDFAYVPKVMQATVDSNQKLNEHKPKALEALFTVGTVLSKYSNIHLDEVQWGVDEGPDVSMMDEEEVIETAQGGDVAVIKAHLNEFPKDYEAAFKQVETFMLSLKADHRVEDVQAQVLPLDINPKNSLVGESQRFGHEPEAKFEIKVWLKNENRDV